MKFKLGDVLVDKRGNRYKVIYAYREHDFPYEAKHIAGPCVGGVRSFGANGEYYGTGYPGHMFDVTLDLNYIVNQMWEEYEV
jgi:hypothetical protein